MAVILDAQAENSRALLLGAVAVLALAYVYRLATRDTSRIPGPWYSRWTSLVLTVYWLKGQRSQYVHALHQRYGPVVRIAPNEVDFCSIAASKIIYSSKEVFVKSKWYTQLTPTSQHSIFNTDNIQLHRRHRRLLSGSMSESSLASMIPAVNVRVKQVIQKMGEEMRSRGAADICKWWLFMTTDIIGELTFGESFRMLDYGKKNQYAEDLQDVGMVSALRSTFPTLVDYASLLPLPIFKRAEQANSNIVRYANESLARHQRLVLQDADKVKQTLFTRLLAGREDGMLEMDEVRTAAETYIIAGSDTTATTLTYLVWAVCRHPEVKERLVKELSDLPSEFEESDLRNLPYLTHVIEEALRLHAAGPSGLPRTVPAGGAEICGHRLDGGTTVCVQAYSMHRDPEIFENPEVFDPRRWEKPTKAMKDAFVPWGGGARVCLGLNLARIELRLAVAHFFRTYPEARMSSLEGMSDEDMVPDIWFLMSPRGRRCLMQQV